MKNHINILGRAVVIVMLVLLAAATTVAVAADNRDRGSLIAVEQEGKVTIAVKQVRDGENISTERIYKVSPYALVFNEQGKRVKPGELKLPADVFFEYSNTTQGAVIKMLKVTPQ